MKRLVPLLLAVGPLIADPIAASANVGGGMTLDLTFQGSCDVHGYIEVDNTSADVVVFENQDDWSASQPIHHVLGATPVGDPGDGLLLRLFAADHATVLFETREFTHHGSEAAYFSDFTGSLDCSVTPYQVVMSDTAIAAPRSSHGLAAIGWVALLLAIASGLDAWRKRPSEMR